MKQRLKTSTAAEKPVILGLRNNVNFTHIFLYTFLLNFLLITNNPLPNLNKKRTLEAQPFGRNKLFHFH